MAFNTPTISPEIKATHHLSLILAISIYLSLLLKVNLPYISLSPS